MKKDTRIGVICIGDFGKTHLRILKELHALQCLCDVDAARANQLSVKYKVKAYTNVEKMLDSEHLDAVTICTPPATHYDIVSKALKRGINTFVERPMVDTSVDGKKLLELSKSSRALLTVGYVDRFNPAVIEAKEAVESREFGEPLLLEFHREKNLIATDLGITADSSAGDIDLACWILNQEPSSVIGRANSQDEEDFAVITLGFAQAKSASIRSNGAIAGRQLTILCTKGVISIDFASQEVRFDSDNGTRISRSEIKEPLTSEVEAFLESIRTGKEPPVRPLDGLNGTIIMEAALLSAQLGEPVILGDAMGHQEGGSRYWQLPLGESKTMMPTIAG